MKLYFRILFCILFVISCECKVKFFKEIVEYVYNLFMLGLDVVDRLEFND